MSDQPKNARDMSDAEFKAACRRIKDEDHERHGVALGLPPSRQGPRYTPEQIEAAAEKARLAAEKAARGPQLPEHLRGRHVSSLSPKERDEANRALGLPRDSWQKVEQEQREWERGHRG
jgi:hypothetical protein